MRRLPGENGPPKPRLLATLASDPVVLREMAATLAVTAVLVVLSGRLLLRGRAYEADLDVTPPASVSDGRTEMPIVSYRGPVGVQGVDSSSAPVRVAEVDVVGIVRGDEQRRFDLAEQMRHHRARLSEAVDVVLRNASAEDLRDPASTAIRAEIFERVRGTLGDGSVDAIAFAHYRVFDVTPLVR